MEQEKQMLPAEAERADDKLVVMMVNQKNRTTKKEDGNNVLHTLLISNMDVELL